jgi:uncharacterized protein YbjT (DUF2867 family)
MVLVTGATGVAGSQVARALSERGVSVRALVRDAAKARAKLGEGVELAVGDLADRVSVSAALNGIEEIVLSCADDPRRVEWETSLIDAAAGSAVRRIVRLSTTAATQGAPVAFWDWHARVDDYLRASGVAAVILQSSFYMSNLLAAAAQVATDARLYAPAGGARIAMIDPRDVGAAAAAAVADAGHEGRTYVLTGPKAITYSRVADQLSAAIGREIEFVDIPGESAHQAMIGAGMPEFVAGQIVAIFDQLRQGVAAQVTDAVEALTGRPPLHFGAFARDHACLFAPATGGPQP